MDLYYPVPRLDKGLLNDAILSLNREVIMAQYGLWASLYQVCLCSYAGVRDGRKYEGRRCVVRCFRIYRKPQRVHRASQ